jgi:putative ABC transport system permease protein
MKNKRVKAPPLARRFLLLFSKYESEYLMEADFSDEFEEKLLVVGKLRAHLWYWKQILGSLPAYIKLLFLGRANMLKNYIKYAFRNLKKYKGFSAINILGLSVGMACCILLLIFIHHELGFDSYHVKASQIYRLCVDVKIGGTEIRGSSSNAVAAGVLRDQFPEVINTARFYWMSRIGGVINKKEFAINRLFYTDPSVFDIFSWPLLQGDSKNALKKPLSMVLTQTTAKRLFGDTSPLGKILKCNNGQNYTITGVVKDVPRSSTIRFNALCSFQTLYMGEVPRRLTDWISFNFRTYLLLAEGVDYKEFQKKISGLLERYAGEELKAKNAREKLFLQPLRDVYLRPLNNPVGPITYVYIFSIIALFVLVIACVNFMNLATARSAKRAMEVGMRKTMGATQNQLITQFLSEALLLSFISLLIGILIVILVLPQISSITNRQLVFNISQMPWLIPGFVLITFFVGIVAGSYPAFFLSAFRPTWVFQRRFKTGAFNNRLRRFLVIFQFTISIILIFCTFIIMDQLDFLRQRDPGFNKEHVVVVPIMDTKSMTSRELLKVKFNSIEGVVRTGSTSNIPGWGSPTNDKIPEGYTRETTQLMDEINVDEDFIPTMAMKIIAGRNFSKDFPADRLNSVIVNETAVKRYGWKNPIGKTIQGIDPYNTDQQSKKIVIGVVKDFYQRPMTSEINPVYIGNDPKNPQYYNFLRALVIRIKPINIDETINIMKKKWAEVISHRPLNYFFLDDNFDSQFRGIENSKQIFSYFTILAILIACLGLFGLSAFTAEQRTKEIGIRKVLGSSIARIVILLCKELILLVAVANVIAWPFAFYLSEKWLLGFPYRIEVSIHPFMFSATLVLIIGGATIAYHAIKAAVINPIETLKYE